MTVSERIAVATGASSGIGAAVANRLIAAGMRIVGNGRDEDRLIGTLRSADPLGTRSIAVAGDVLHDATLARRGLVLGETLRIPKPGGCFALTDFFSVRPFDRRSRCAWETYANLVRLIHALLTLEEYSRLCQDLGFVNLQIEPVPDAISKSRTLLHIADGLAVSREAFLELFPADMMDMFFTGVASSP